MNSQFHCSKQVLTASFLPTDLTNSGPQAMAHLKLGQSSMDPGSLPQNLGDLHPFLESIPFPNPFPFHLPGVFKKLMPQVGMQRLGVVAGVDLPQAAIAMCREPLLLPHSHVWGSAAYCS